MAYKALIDRFDMERGDALTLPLDTATELAALPCEIAAPVIHALLVWFTGGEVATLPDPRDNALLRRLVVHQKQNAERRADYLASRRKNRLGGDMSTHDDISDKYKNKSKASVNVALDRDEVNRAACAAPPAGFSALQAEPADLKGTVQTAVYFDGIMSSYCAPDWADAAKGDKPMHTREITDADFKADPVSALTEYPDFETDADKARFRNALIARFKADKRQFILTAWKYLAEAHNARVALLAAFRGKCADCKADGAWCNEECPHEHLKSLLANYTKDYGREVFAKNLLGRLKVLKP